MPRTFVSARWMRSAALVGALALVAPILSGTSARAQGVPVVDTQNIAQNIEQLRQMIEDEILQNEQLVQLREQLTTLTDQLAELQRTVSSINAYAEQYVTQRSEVCATPSPSARARSPPAS